MPVKIFFLCVISCWIICSPIQADNLPQDLTWLVGNWRSESQGNIFEEHWSKPIKNNLTGAARSIKVDGRGDFFELMILEKNKTSWEMRILHFGPDLVLLHEKPLVYSLVEYEPKKLIFKNLGTDTVRYIVYDGTEQNILRISLFTEKNKLKEVFKLKYF